MLPVGTLPGINRFSFLRFLFISTQPPSERRYQPTTGNQVAPRTHSDWLTIDSDDLNLSWKLQRTTQVVPNMESEDELFTTDVQAQNTRGAIKDRLPDLDIGVEGIETTSRSSLRITYTQQMEMWPDFFEDVARFYFSGKANELFTRTSKVLTGFPLDFAEKWEGIAVVEPVQVGDELTMSGRFAQHVIGKVLRVILAFNSAKYDTAEQLRVMRDIPSSTIKIGSSKINPMKQRPQGESDIIVKFPGDGGKQLIRLVGELKSPSTYKMSEHYKNFNSFDPDSMKNLFGQVARDMRSFGIKYGFVSTYEETIFLKIVKRSNGDHALHFSPIIKHFDRTKRKYGRNKLETLSVRLCLLYILALVSDENERYWSFNPTDIDESSWTRGKKDVPSDLVGESATPQKDTSVLDKYPPREGMRRKTSDSSAEARRKFEETRRENVRRQRVQEETGMTTGASVLSRRLIQRRGKRMDTIDDDDDIEE